MAHRSASDISIRKTEWLWPGHLPRGQFVLLNGRQGDGKGTMGASWMAALSAGSPLPNGYRRDPVNCAVLSLEDTVDSTVVPRLMAAGANLGRVEVLDGVDDVDGDGNYLRRPWRMPEDLPALHAASSPPETLAS